MISDIDRQVHICSPTGTEEFDTSGFPLRFESKTRALAVSIDSRDIEQTCCLGAISRGGGQGNLDTKPRKLGGAGSDRFGVASERCHEARPRPCPLQSAPCAMCPDRMRCAVGFNGCGLQ